MITTQDFKILQLFKTAPVISVQYIQSKIPCNSPRRVISTLRNKGYDIRDRWVDHIAPDGRKTRYKEYWLVKGANDDNVL